jgi:hypothetical protein
MPVFCASIRLVYRNPNRLYGNSSIGAEESVKIFHLSKMFAWSKKKIKRPATPLRFHLKN